MTDRIQRQVADLRHVIVVDGLPLSRPDQKHLDAADTIEALLEAYEAAKALRDDLKLRAEIGTHDGDHTIQCSISKWFRINDAIAKVEGLE